MAFGEKQMKGLVALLCIRGGSFCLVLFFERVDNFIIKRIH